MVTHVMARLVRQEVRRNPSLSDDLVLVGVALVGIVVLGKYLQSHNPVAPGGPIGQSFSGVGTWLTTPITVTSPAFSQLGTDTHHLVDQTGGSIGSTSSGLGQWIQDHIVNANPSGVPGL